MDEDFKFSFYDEWGIETYDFSKLIEEDVKSLSSLLTEGEEDEKENFFNDRIYIVKVDLMLGDFIRIKYGFEDKNDGSLLTAMGHLYSNDFIETEEKTEYLPEIGDTAPQIYW